ncbi:MAG: DUF5615 family PIN-like protein [Armatimonadetes bacterium]|nr:DUF5615 family PIN-like protein [Armatimonadota bacterium]
MRVRLYIDEDSQDHDLVRAFRSRGLDVVTSTDAGMNGATDRAQLDHATTSGSVLYTYNVGDFCQLHRECCGEGRRHGGIIVARQWQFSIGEQLRRVLRVVESRPADKMRSRLEFLSSRE